MARIYDLSNLDSEEGFIIQGAVGEHVGRSVSNAGDVNGDGIDDVIVGAYPSDYDGAEASADAAAGLSFVLFGRDTTGGAAPFSTIDLAALAPSDGFIIKGDAAGDRFGRSVSSAGDVNGDGIDDLIVGAYLGDDGGNGAGEAYVIFGRDVAGGANAFGTIDVSTLDPTDGFIIQGSEPGDLAGESVSGAGDVNGDGIDDLIVSAPNNDDGGDTAGAAYVIFGRDVAGGATAFGDIDLSALDPADGFIIQGDAWRDRPDDAAPPGGNAGSSISSAGDLNGDGIDDLIVGATWGVYGNIEPGLAYVVFGRDVAGGDAAFDTIDLHALDPADGFTIRGKYHWGKVGDSVSGAGDVNGDGIDDLIVGAPGVDADGDRSVGEAYVVFGRDVAGGATPFGPVDLANLDPADGFTIRGDGNFHHIGTSVSNAGDVNSDGIDDLIVGADGRSSGKAYVVYGRDSAGGGGASADIDLSNLDPSEGFIIRGDALGDLLGTSVSRAGDVNGDGIDDLIVGADGGDDGGLWAGEAYVIYGKPPSLALRGDAAANTLTGDANDDTLRGLGGNDLLEGALGNDELRGGADDDTLYGGKGDDVLYGNRGDDTLYGELGSDTLHGRAGDDTLHGGSESDYLRGNRGADVLSGGAGRDKLKGGPGQDTLEGGGGDDMFLFRRVDDSQAGSGDTIVDFETGERILLKRIDADATSAGTNEAFTWIADAAFSSAAGELRYEVMGADTLVQADVDGDGLADLEITLRGVTSLAETDFVL